MLIEGRVGAQRLNDGADGRFRLGNAGEQIVSALNPGLYEQAQRGNMFVYHIASQALLLTATTGGHPTVINPRGSGRNFVPVALRICFTSGTTVIGSVLIASTTGVAAVATGAGSPILTATLVDAVSALVGAGQKSSMLWSPTTNTFTTAPTILAASGLNLGAAAPTGTGTYEAKFDGALVFAPGSAMSIVYSVTTSTALFHVTILGLEVPLPLTA